MGAFGKEDEAMVSPLTEKLKRLTGELDALAGELKADPAPDLSALSDFRTAVDNVRVAAWSISELMNARHSSKNPQSVLTFLVGQRLRRFEQMANDVCLDLDDHVLPRQEYLLQPIARAVNALQERLKSGN